MRSKGVLSRGAVAGCVSVGVGVQPAGCQRGSRGQPVAVVSSHVYICACTYIYMTYTAQQQHTTDRATHPDGVLWKPDHQPSCSQGRARVRPTPPTLLRAACTKHAARRARPGSRSPILAASVVLSHTPGAGAAAPRQRSVISMVMDESRDTRAGGCVMTTTTTRAYYLRVRAAVVAAAHSTRGVSLVQ